MQTRTPTLHAILAVVTAAVTGIALVIAATLVVLTTHLGHASGTLAAVVESVRLAEEAEVALLLHDRTEDAGAKQGYESRLQSILTRAHGYVSSEEEGRVMDEAEARIREYLSAAREAPAPARLTELHEGAFRALEALVDINVGQARAAQEHAERWDRWGDLVGYTAIALLLLQAGWLLWWLKARAFRPVLGLLRAMERFSRGDRGARAEESGAAELRDIARRFNEMADSLVAQRDAQMAFLGGVAHDLRTPLAALMMSATMIRPDEALPPEAAIRRLFQISERQIRHLERMLGDLIDMAKVEAGQLALELVTEDARKPIRAACELFEGTSPEHRLEVATPDAPLLLRCDALRIEQVVNNLVSNAIKYSPRGSTVRVALTREADEAVFAVTDQGVGISAEDQKRLFEPFRRVGLSRESIPGVGLGLFVVRRIVEAHGGRIAVESAPGQGSTFRVHLPLDRDPAPAHGQGPQAGAAERLLLG